MNPMQQPQLDRSNARQALVQRLGEIIDEMKGQQAQCSEEPLDVMLNIAANGTATPAFTGVNDDYRYFFESAISRISREEPDLLTIFGTPQQFKLHYGRLAGNVDAQGKYNPPPLTPQDPTYAPYPTPQPFYPPPGGTNTDYYPPPQAVPPPAAPSVPVLQNGHFQIPGSPIKYTIAVNKAAPHGFTGWARLEPEEGAYHWAYGVVHRQTGDYFEVTAVSADPLEWNSPSPQSLQKLPGGKIYVRLSRPYQAPYGIIDKRIK
jgi:hypothetical protein